MKAYLDSKALGKLYYPEVDSRVVQAWLLRTRPRLLFTPLHSLEISNAMARKLFRREISADAFARRQLQFERDQLQRVIIAFASDWSWVFRDAERIARDLSGHLGTCALDVRHLSVARCIPTEVFVTNDARRGHAARGWGHRCSSWMICPDECMPLRKHPTSMFSFGAWFATAACLPLQDSS